MSNIVMSGNSGNYVTFSGSHTFDWDDPFNGKDKKRKRAFTGNARGRTEEQKKFNIRRRVSYQALVQEVKVFLSLGVPCSAIPKLLKRHLNYKIQWRGFPYRSNELWAKQSLDLLLEDLQDPEQRKELNL